MLARKMLTAIIGMRGGRSRGKGKRKVIIKWFSESNENFLKIYNMKKETFFSLFFC